MASLGSLAVIKKTCIQCGKVFTPELDCYLFDSIGCAIEWKDEAKEIDASYEGND